ncbi:MAG: 50S ribosomal protein L18 [bacterium]
MKRITKQQKLEARQRRVRSTIFGTAIRPRLAVTRSLNHIVAQLVDDTLGRTVVAVNDLKEKKGTKQEHAVLVGKRIAEMALAKGISQAVFDRRGRRYHGRIKALAEAAREAGLRF